jgi:hypothetical protein
MREIRARSSGHFNDEFVVRAHVCTSTQMADGERIVVFFIMAETDKFNWISMSDLIEFDLNNLINKWSWIKWN